METINHSKDYTFDPINGVIALVNPVASTPNATPSSHYAEYKGTFYKLLDDADDYNVTTFTAMKMTVEPYAHVIGNGIEDIARSNAHTLDWEGNAWYSGDVYVGSTSGTNKDSGSKKLATEDFVEAKIQTTLHLKRKVVDALPDLSIAEPEVIYMVPRPMQLVDNVYDEYMLIDGAWELIGSTSVDLTDYATKEEVEQKAQVQILIWEDDD